MASYLSSVNGESHRYHEHHRESADDELIRGDQEDTAQPIEYCILRVITPTFLDRNNLVVAHTLIEGNEKEGLHERKEDDGDDLEGVAASTRHVTLVEQSNLTAQANFALILN